MDADWQADLEHWLDPFLKGLGNKTRRRMCPAYIAGLIGPGDRKSIQPMAGGDDGLWAEDIKKFMLLTGSSQRKKSFSCERCPNFLKLREPSICGTCYWAFPEAYDHIAMRKVRQLELVWQDEEADAFDRIKAKLAAEGRTIEEAAKVLLLTLDK